MTPRPTVAVVICAYTEDRWTDLLAAHRSIEGQSVPADEVVVVIDHNPALLARLRQELPQVRIVANRGTQGLSGARNTGIDETTADVVLFLDDDAAAEPDWVAAMAAPFDDQSVVGVGGWAEPNWAAPAGHAGFQSRSSGWWAAVTRASPRCKPTSGTRSALPWASGGRHLIWSADSPEPSAGSEPIRSAARRPNSRSGSGRRRRRPASSWSRLRSSTTG